MHGFYLDEKEKIISFDIIIDFNAEHREEIYRRSEATMFLTGIMFALSQCST